MGKVILGMTMSLDGFVADQNGSVGSLYPDLEDLRNTDMLQESIKTTGAVVMGRRAYAMGDPDSYADNYEYQAPIFVLTKNTPKKLPKSCPCCFVKGFDCSNTLATGQSSWKGSRSSRLLSEHICGSAKGRNTKEGRCSFPQ